MNLSKQSLLGATMLIFGGVTLVAMVQQSQPSDAKKQDIEEITQQEKSATDAKKDAVTLTAVDAEGKEVEDEALAKEIETEAKLAETKKEQREQQSKDQEKQAKNFIQQHEKAKEQAKLAEQSKYKATTKGSTEITVGDAKKTAKPAKEISQPKVTNRDEAITKQQPMGEPANNPATYYAKKGDSMYKIAEDHGISLEVLAEANDVYYLDPLMYGQKLLIPSKSQVAELKKTARKAQNKRGVVYQAKQKKEQERKAAIRKKRAEKRKATEARIAKEKATKAKVIKAAKAEADKAKVADKKKAPIKKKVSTTKTSAAERKLQKARVTAKKENARGTFGVQVALAGDQENADKIAAKFKKAGYKTKTSQTTRGVRVIIGPERGKKAALALKDKINSDGRTGVKNAWVLYWR